MPHYRWRSTANLARLEKDLAAARMTVIVLRQELETREGAVRRLELTLVQRHRTIDNLNGTIERLRAVNQRLDAENEHLCEMVRLSP